MPLYYPLEANKPAMKRIEAIIKPFKLDEVTAALKEAGIEALTVVEGKGFGKHRAHSELYRGSEYTIDFLIYILLILVVSDKSAETVVGIIRNAARTGRTMDGIIIVTDVADLVRIRDGERGDAAL